MNVVAQANLFMFSSGSDIWEGTTDTDKAVPVSKVGSTRNGDQILQLGMGDGNYLFWTEGHYDQNPNSAPCEFAGALTWSLYTLSGDGATELTTSGVNSYPRMCEAMKPLFATDGSRLALAQEAPRDGHQQAWQITLMNGVSGATIRTIDTDEDVTSVGVSGDNVAYTEGTYDSDQQPYWDINTRLMLSTANNPDPVEIAADAYDVSYHNDRLAWANDPSSSQQSDVAPGPSFMTATTSNVIPQRLAADPGLPLRPPFAAGDRVAWADGGDLLVADMASATVAKLSGTGDVDRAFLTTGSVDGGYVEDGWLSWLTINGDASLTVEAIDLTDLFPPPPAPSPTPSPPATPIPPQSVAPPETLQVDGLTWARFEGSALPNIGGFYGAEEIDGHFLVTAYRCSNKILLGSDDCARSQVLLSSEDGLSWTELGTVVTEPDGAGQFYQDGSLILAMGSRGTDEDAQHGIWRSTDGGLNWSFVVNPPVASPDCGSDDGVDVYQIVSDGSQLIGIGTGIWHSSDGLTWTCAGSPPSHIGIIYGNGIFVGIGSTSSASLPDWFWRSADGTNWTKIERAPLNTTMVPVGGGFVAIGGADGYSAPTRLLTSADGLSWHDQPYPFGEAGLSLEASDGNRAVAIEDGYSSTGGENEPGAVWVSSPDGVTWTRYRLPPRAGDQADSAAILGNRVVVTGCMNTGDGNDCAVLWSAQIP